MTNEEGWVQVSKANASMTIRSPDGENWKVYGGESLLKRLNEYHQQAR